MMKSKKNILWIDWGSNYIGLAYINTRWENIVMPIWYILNDPSALYNIADIIARYNIWKIVIWYPKQEEIRKKVDDFINQLNLVIEGIPIEKVDEEYSSVQASSINWNFKKDEKQDTLAAMVILENYLKKFA